MPQLKLPADHLPALLRGACLLGLVLLASVASGQTTVTVYDSTGWTPWISALTNSQMTDIRADHQTGQSTDDFVGDSTYAGFQQKAGILNGQDSFLFRARLDTFAGTNQWGNGGNFGLGLDLNGDGRLDLIVMMTEGSGAAKNRTRTVTFGTPGTGANISPSTTSWSFASQTPIDLTVDTDYALTATNDGFNFNNTQDAWLTFGLSFANLQAGIRAYAGAEFANFTVTYSTMISFIAFTSTQSNALNQDLYGAGNLGNLDPNLTFSQLGALTPPIDAFGKVPEPATYAQLAALLLAGGVVAYRRRRTAAPATEPAAADTPVSPCG